MELSDGEKQGFRRPSLLELFLSFLSLGAVAFGGPAMVAYIGRMAVTRRRWISEEDFREGVALCQAVPGATAMQCVGYIGLRARRLPGAIVAYIAFGLPAFLLMLILALAYRRASQLAVVTSAMAGLRVIVVALVANAAWSFGRSSIESIRHGAVSAGAAVLFLMGGNPFLVVLATGLVGVLLLRVPRPLENQGVARHPDGSRVLRDPSLVLMGVLGVAAALLVWDHDLAALGLVMMKVDFFAFGGGFASVPLMFREVVEVHGWMPAGAFMDGIALGQVTPGPIVITATFVGHQVAGIPGACVATVCIFLPSLFIVVLAEPWFDCLRSSPAFQGAVCGLLLSFVGLLGSVTIQFARAAPWSIISALIAAGALTALLRKVDVVWVVLAGAAISTLFL